MGMPNGAQRRNPDPALAAKDLLFCVDLPPRSEANLEPHEQRAAGQHADLIERRGQPRFKLAVDIKIYSRTSGMLKGRTVDISESGISAMVSIEVPVGELVELDFTLPPGRVRIYATVRQRNAFRYGFQFLESDSISKVIRPSCRQLAVEQSLLAGL